MISLTLLSLLLAAASSALAGEPLAQFTQESNTATGEYGFSYSGGPSAKTEYRAIDGTVTGAYSYVDPYGHPQTVNYIADEFGFRAAGTNIPSAPHYRRKRGVLAADHVLVHAAAPVVQHAPLATSHQSRHQIHKGAKLYVQHEVPVVQSALHLLRKKRGVFAGYASPIEYKLFGYAAPHPLAYVAPHPLAYAADPHQVAYAAPLVKTVSQHLLPLATSRQSRFQVHNGGKIIEQQLHPLYAPATAVHTEAAYLPSASLPVAAPALPVVPAEEQPAVIAPANEASVASVAPSEQPSQPQPSSDADSSDSISVESA